MSWPWKPVDWVDPEGGTIRLYPYLPTTIHPRGLRPRDDWDGVAFLLHEEEVESWDQEDEMEKSSPGASRVMALQGGGDMAKMLSRLEMIDDVQVGRFPDPEPRRLYNYAEKVGLPYYFVEPGVDDEEWLDWMERSAIEASRPLRMVGHLFARRRFRKTWKRVQPEVTEPKIKQSSESLALIAGLAATWWRLSEAALTNGLREERDERLIGRLRGALADLREQKKDPLMIVPIIQDWVPEILATLKKGGKVEPLESNKEVQ